MVPKDDARAMNTLTLDIVDEDNANDAVGELSFERGVGRHVSMYGGKYKATFQTHAECVAFVRGIQAVLQHLIE